jgi:hypothetical protein
MNTFDLKSFHLLSCANIKDNIKKICYQLIFKRKNIL